MPVIDSLKYGEVAVEGRTYYSDMIIWWDSKLEYLEKTHTFPEAFLRKLLKRKPQAVVVGTGLEGTVKILPGVRELAKKRKVKLFVDRTGNAVEIFNGLLANKKKVVAILHVTL